MGMIALIGGVSAGVAMALIAQRQWRGAHSPDRAAAVTEGRSAHARDTALADAVLAALPHAAAILDATGTIRRANDAWVREGRDVRPGFQHLLAVGSNYLDACRGAIGMWDPLESTCRHASLSIL